MILLPIVILAAVLGIAASRGRNLFKKQSVAWVLTVMMVVAAIGIGYAKAPINGPTPDAAPRPSVGLQQGPGTAPSSAPAASESFVWDNARVLSDQTVQVLDARNDRLWRDHQASVGVVTCNYGGDDLYSYAIQCAEDMGLGGYDFIVVLDISGENYWLLQGNDIRRDFTDNDCSNYAYDYMEDFFAQGMYGDAVLALTEALEVWYGNYYD